MHAVQECTPAVLKMHQELSHRGYSRQRVFTFQHDYACAVTRLWTTVDANAPSSSSHEVI